jgi:hypothetical protein
MEKTRSDLAYIRYEPIHTNSGCEAIGVRELFPLSVSSTKSDLLTNPRILIGTGDNTRLLARNNMSGEPSLMAALGSKSLWPLIWLTIASPHQSKAEGTFCRSTVDVFYGLL